MTNPFAHTLQSFKAGLGRSGKFHSLPELARAYPNVRRLPMSMRIDMGRRRTLG
jgi:aconitate hydratase